MTPRNTLNAVVVVPAKALISPTVPNYQITAAASGLFALSYLWSSFEGCTSSYLNAGLAVATAALALNQLGLVDNSYKMAISAVHCVSNVAVSKYHSLFASKPETIRAAPAKAEVKDPLGANKETARVNPTSPAMKNS